MSPLLLSPFPACCYCSCSCSSAICFCASRLLQQCFSFAALLHSARKAALRRPTQTAAAAPAVAVWPHFCNKEKNLQKQETFPIPKRKEKSTRRDHPKTNNSGQAANTKRQSKLPKKKSLGICFFTQTKTFCVDGFCAMMITEENLCSDGSP
jgi:hypothetical protein